MRNEEAKMSEIDRENIGAITGDWASGDVFINGKHWTLRKVLRLQTSVEWIQLGMLRRRLDPTGLAILLRYVPRLTALKPFYDFRCDIISKLPRCGFQL